MTLIPSLSTSGVPAFSMPVDAASTTTSDSSFIH
jgi:hypothetical protein